MTRQNLALSSDPGPTVQSQGRMSEGASEVARSLQPSLPELAAQHWLGTTPLDALAAPRVPGDLLVEDTPAPTPAQTVVDAPELPSRRTLPGLAAPRTWSDPRLSFAREEEDVTRPLARLTKQQMSGAFAQQGTTQRLTVASPRADPLDARIAMLRDLERMSKLLQGSLPACSPAAQDRTQNETATGQLERGRRRRFAVVASVATLVLAGALAALVRGTSSPRSVGRASSALRQTAVAQSPLTHAARATTVARYEPLMELELTDDGEHSSQQETSAAGFAQVAADTLPSTSTAVLLMRAERLLDADHSAGAAAVARDLLAAAIRREPGNPHLHAAQAEACVRLRDFRCASAAAERATHLRPRRDAYRVLADKIEIERQRLL